MAGLRPFRCHNPACHPKKPNTSGFDFWAETPKCPKCGISQTDARTGGLISDLVIVHFDPPSQVRGIGLGHLACDPKHEVGTGKKQVSGDPVAVNCPKCQGTEAHKKAMEEAEGRETVEAADFPVGWDQETMTIKRG